MEMAEASKIPAIRMLTARAKWLAAARRPLGGTGAYQQFSDLLKLVPGEYGDKEGLPYVPFVAAHVDEPSNLEHCVDMLECMHPEIAGYYSKEASVLEGGNPRDTEFEALQQRYSYYTGDRREYLGYLD